MSESDLIIEVCAKIAERYATGANAAYAIRQLAEEIKYQVFVELGPDEASFLWPPRHNPS